MCSSDENGPSCPQKMHLKGGFVVEGLISIVPNSSLNARAELRVFHDNGGVLVIMEGSSA